MLHKVLTDETKKFSAATTLEDALGKHNKAKVVCVQGDVVDGAVARKRQVQVAFIDGDTVALASGLAIGTVLVTEGALYLVDGERISPITTEAN